MPVWVWIVIAALAVEAIVLAFVFTRVRVRWAVTWQQVGDLKAFAADVDQLVTSYVPAHYGGQPAELPGVLSALLDRTRTLASSRGLALDEDVLRSLLVQAVAARRVAGRGDAQRAMDAVPRADAGRAA